jgi:hypothetical protein
MTAPFIIPGSSAPADLVDTMELVDNSEALDGRLSLLVGLARGTADTSDVDLRAEHRVWGSWPKAMRAMTRPLKREEVPEKSSVAIGFADRFGGDTFTRRTKEGQADVQNGHTEF